MTYFLSSTPPKDSNPVYVARTHLEFTQTARPARPTRPARPPRPARPTRPTRPARSARPARPTSTVHIIHKHAVSRDNAVLTTTKQTKNFK